jgi:hypothetical protein
VPLHAEDFATPTDFIGAALELLGPRPTEEQVTVLMQSAGLNPGSPGIPFSEGSKDPDVDILEFSGAGTGMLFFVTGCTNSIHVIWSVDKKTGTVAIKNPEEFHTAIGACL